MPSPLENHPYFTSWTDPVSGVRSFLLSEHVAPVQWVIYYVNSAVSADGKWLWFGAGYPPSPYKRLGVVSLDPAKPSIKAFEQATFHSESQLITPKGDSCYFASGTAVYKIDVNGEVETIFTLPESILKNRLLIRVATHLTISADGKYMLIDGAFAIGRWFVAIGDMETGEVRLLKEWTRHMNHAQFSPVDPKLFSIAQDWWHDPHTGQFNPIDQRIWLMDIDETIYEPLRPSDWVNHGSDACHEWWDKQGRSCWVSYNEGAMRCDVATREVEHVWKRPLCHAHCDHTGELWGADQSAYSWNEKPCEVLFFNSRTQREAAIFSGMPPPPLPRHPLHLDPHPHFSPDGRYIVTMTTVRGLCEVALVEVDQLVAMTS